MIDIFTAFLSFLGSFISWEGLFLPILFLTPCILVVPVALVRLIK